MDRPGGNKVCLTKVHQSTEEFLRAAFTSVSNADRRQLRQRFIVLDTPFTAAPRLDKVMAGVFKELKARRHLSLEDPGTVPGCYRATE